MSIYSYPLEVAYRNYRENSLARWGAREQRQLPGRVFASERLVGGIFYPGVSFDPKIAATDQIFTIGSCFARNIERALFDLGIEALSFRPSRFSKGLVTGYVNRFNTASMLNEFRWAAGEPFPESHLVEHSDSGWSDPHSHPVQQKLPRLRLLAFRKGLAQYFAQAYSAEVVILTLGLIEGWYDRREQVFLNCMPVSGQRMVRDEERFELRVLSYEENVANLEAIHALIHQHNPSARIIVTVSPVPLMATFTNRDVVTANMLSKSMLRTAAEAWTSAHPDIQYFPSYEMATMSDRSRVYQQDGIHIKDRFVDKIMQLFVENCLAAPPPKKPALGEALARETDAVA